MEWKKVWIVYSIECLNNTGDRCLVFLGSYEYKDTAIDEANIYDDDGYCTVIIESYKRDF